MSAIKIYDGVASIRLEIDGVIKLISKQTVKSVEVVNNRLCIDAGQGTLHNLFIDHSDVIDPIVPDIAALQHAIQGMLQSTEADFLNLLQQIASNISDIKLTLDGTRDYFKEPLRVEDTGLGRVYRGYSSILAANPSEPVWAVSLTAVTGSITVTRWANGNKDFTCVWDDRFTLDYLP